MYQTLTGHDDLVCCMIIVANGIIASGSNDKTIKIWDTKSGKCVNTLTGHHGWVYCMISVANGIIASGSYDTTIRKQ